MPTRRFPRPLHPVRVRAAQAQLLDEPSTALLERVREVFCEPARTQIVRALSAGPLSVSDLAITVGRSRSSISQHLRILRQENVVQARRRGRVSYYALTSNLVARSSLLALDVIAGAASESGAARSLSCRITMPRRGIEPACCTIGAGGSVRVTHCGSERPRRGAA